MAKNKKLCKDPLSIKLFEPTIENIRMDSMKLDRSMNYLIRKAVEAVYGTKLRL